MNARISRVLAILIVAMLAVGTYWEFATPSSSTRARVVEPDLSEPTESNGQSMLGQPKPRGMLPDSGFGDVMQSMPQWNDPTSLIEIRDAMYHAGYRLLAEIDQRREEPHDYSQHHLHRLAARGLCYLYEGEPGQAYIEFTRAREIAEADALIAHQELSSIIFLQGIAGLRQGESENCIHCRGQGACVFPILATAVHLQPEGSQRAIRHFTEYLERHNEDRGVKWLLNVAYMTLGQYPREVPHEFLLALESIHQEPDRGIGKFRDIAHLAGVNRLSQAGGAIMEDFDNDGRLDLVATSWDAAVPLALYHNQGDGTFQDLAEKAGLGDQLGGLNCVQTDYDNDGLKDIYVIRGAWHRTPMRPSLLRNNGDGTFADVTRATGLMDPVNAIVARWADYDNDGHLDLFIGCDFVRNRLYRNNGNGGFEEVAATAGVAKCRFCRGASWGDFNGDGYPDLFVNNLEGQPQLYQNNCDGTFRDVATQLGITTPTVGFSCWFWDYDNDGWLDIYATGYERSVDGVVKSLTHEPTTLQTDRLYRNLDGKAFSDVSKEIGVDLVTAPMGSNYADFDNDGFLDFYLGTGDPNYSTLIPNRMFRNIAGKHFADITIASRTGHLQKGHGVACGDWDRDGNVDLFVQIGGATPGDVFHDALFQNPGNHGNCWLNVRLVGQRSNRAAIGARIKVVTAGTSPQTIYRHVNSGSSFGSNSLEQLIGLGKAEKVARLEIDWPTSKTTQVFENVALNQALEITEFAESYRHLAYEQIPSPN